MYLHNWYHNLIEIQVNRQLGDYVPIFHETVSVFFPKFLLSIFIAEADSGGVGGTIVGRGASATLSTVIFQLAFFA